MSFRSFLMVFNATHHADGRESNAMGKELVLKIAVKREKLAEALSKLDQLGIKPVRTALRKDPSLVSILLPELTAKERDIIETEFPAELFAFRVNLHQNYDE